MVYLKTTDSIKMIYRLCPTLQKYNGENIRKVDGLRFALPFLRFAFLLKISPDVHFLPCFLVKPNSLRKFAS